MKVCPTCNRTFDADWLSFCSQDGTILVEAGPAAKEQLPTQMAPPPMPPSVSPSEQPTIYLPGSSPSQQPGPYTPPAPAQSWQPPPPPAYATGPKQGLPITSMLFGLFSVSFGWCCGSGVLSAPVAIILGGISLNQIKNNPQQNTGKPLAITGIVAGSVYLVVFAIIILIWGVSVFMQGIK
jgi:hypothetical protein